MPILTCRRKNVCLGVAYNMGDCVALTRKNNLVFKIMLLETSKQIQVFFNNKPYYLSLVRSILYVKNLNMFFAILTIIETKMKIQLIWVRLCNSQA